MYSVQRGVGYLPKIGANGQVVDCDLWSNIFQSVCWNPFDPGLPVTPAPGGDGGVSPVLPAAVVPVLPSSSTPGAFPDWLMFGLIIVGGVLAVRLIK